MSEYHYLDTIQSHPPLGELFQALLAAKTAVIHEQPYEWMPTVREKTLWQDR